MFIGSGFDTDGDGDNDIYIGTRVGRNGNDGSWIVWMLFTLPILLFFAFIGLYGGFHLLAMIWDIFVETGAADAAAKSAVSGFWAIVSFLFWATMCLLCLFAIVVMLLGIFYKEKT